MFYLLLTLTVLLHICIATPGYEWRDPLRHRPEEIDRAALKDDHQRAEYLAYKAGAMHRGADQMKGKAVVFATAQNSELSQANSKRMAEIGVMREQNARKISEMASGYDLRMIQRLSGVPLSPARTGLHIEVLDSVHKQQKQLTAEARVLHANNKMARLHAQAKIKDVKAAAAHHALGTHYLKTGHEATGHGNLYLASGRLAQAATPRKGPSLPLRKSLRPKHGR